MMKHYEVVAAVIEHDGKILCMQRNKGKFDYVSYKFEFPGGKVEAGEERHTALERELREEMDMDISIPEDAYLMTVEHTYPDFAITMHAYVCKLAQPKFIMKEHVAAKWLAPADLNTLDWAAADMPIVERLLSEEKLLALLPDDGRRIRAAVFSRPPSLPPGTLTTAAAGHQSRRPRCAGPFLFPR